MDETPVSPTYTMLTYLGTMCIHTSSILIL